MDIVAEKSDNHSDCQWYKVASLPNDNLWEYSQNNDVAKFHTCINGRYITIVKFKSDLHAIDSTCYHASGELGLGVVRDIEDIHVIVCPTHNYFISLQHGIRLRKQYNGVDISGGKPVINGWIHGDKVQRVHDVKEDNNGIYVALNLDNKYVPSDEDACSSRYIHSYNIHNELPVALP